MTDKLIDQYKDSSCYCISLRRASNALTRFYDDSFKELGLTVNQYALLSNLSKGHTATVTKLAGILRLDRTTVTRKLKPLFDAGLIQDVAKNGRRNREIQLTESGRAAVEACHCCWLNTQREIQDRIGLEELDSFVSKLKLIESINCTDT